MMKKILTIAILFYAPALYAADVLVSSVAELNAALSIVRPGESIIWKSGTYADIVIDFTAPVKGNAAQRIYLKAEIPGKTVFTGRSRIFIAGEYLQVEGFLFDGPSTLGEREDVIVFHAQKKTSRTAIHCRLTNCALINYTPADAHINNDWIILYGTDNEVDHCSLKGKTNQGPFLVVTYEKPEGFVDGSDKCPSTRHHVHHNYFGFRSMPTDNGGEDIRTGDSKTSFTRGFNVFEYNFFEDHRNEPEVISNKSCDNIYRYNSFYNCDGALVLRHGNRCLVYGNYINGKTGRGYSGGIRIIGQGHTVFNNYLENQEGAAHEEMKAPVTIMAGMPSSPVSGYFAADSAVVCFNTIVNATGPVFHIGVKNKTDNPIQPKQVTLEQNIVIRPQGTNAIALVADDPASIGLSLDNVYAGGKDIRQKGWSAISDASLTEKNGFWYANAPAAKNALLLIRKRTEPFQLSLNDEDIAVFNPLWVLQRKDAGASWKP